MFVFSCFAAMMRFRKARGPWTPGSASAFGDPLAWQPVIHPPNMINRAFALHSTYKTLPSRIWAKALISTCLLRNSGAPNRGYKASAMERGLG